MKPQAVSASGESTTRGSVRLYYLDWLRVLTILTVFVYHSTRFFNMEDWHVKDPIWYSWVEVWNVFAGTWIMLLYEFVIRRFNIMRLRFGVAPQWEPTARALRLKHD